MKANIKELTGSHSIPRTTSLLCNKNITLFGKIVWNAEEKSGQWKLLSRKAQPAEIKTDKTIGRQLVNPGN